MKRDLLKNGRLFLFATSFIFLIGCSEKPHDLMYQAEFDTYLVDNYKLIKEVRQIFQDTIESWIKDELGYFVYFPYGEYYVDEVLIFNRKRDEIFTTINRSNPVYNNVAHDSIEQYRGYKINGKWYFISMNNILHVPREMYQNLFYEPLTQEELSLIAHKEFFGRPFDRNLNNDLVVDTIWWNRMMVIKNRKNEIINLEPVFLNSNKRVAKNRINKDEVKNVIKKLTKVVLPTEPRPKRKKNSQRLFSPNRTKIFESKEWEDYLKDKRRRFVQD